MKNETKMDGRVSPGMLLEKRKQVVNLFKKGMRLKDISEATGLCWQAIRNAIDLYEQRGVKGLEPGRRGRPAGKGRRLTAEQERQVQKDICDRRPEQLKMEFALWTRGAVLVYIREHFGIEMPVRTVGEYLTRLSTFKTKSRDFARDFVCFRELSDEGLHYTSEDAVSAASALTFGGGCAGNVRPS